MTVIAWDGKTIAADKQSTNGGMKILTNKLVRLDNGTVLASTGSTDSGRALIDWYIRSDGKKDEWPKCQQDKDRWAYLVVATPKGVHWYEQECVLIPVVGPFQAWGSGQDFAMAAMAMGATAKEAVELANSLSSTCGMGVDVVEL